MGAYAARSITTANDTTAVGYNALQSIIQLDTQTEYCYWVMSCIICKHNRLLIHTAVGHEALMTPTGSTYNVAVGSAALKLATTGASNTALGAEALDTGHWTGSSNVAVGSEALR